MRNTHYKLGQTKRFFEGWYLKHEGRDETIAFIPGIRFDKSGAASAFLQVVMRDRSVWAEYPAESLYADPKRFYVKIGDCEFTENYARIAFNREGLSLSGTIAYGEFTALPYDIMGPFQLSMQCSHGIISLSHALHGSLLVNCKRIDFDGGRGYIEKDFGHSFPSKYTWVHMFDPHTDASVVAAVATVPLPVIKTAFTGVIAVAVLGGKQYRFATYNGARIIESGQKCLRLKRGRTELNLFLPAAEGQYLRAPEEGEMSRYIKEHTAAHVTAELREGGRTLWRFETDRACFECVAK